ncbi:hypothetical protein C8F01DRAFT_1154533, partial [Mycena amicta]
MTSLPPINLLFAEVLQRQLDQPAPPPVRRPSAWPGFPGPDKDALSTFCYAGGCPPPLQVGRRASAPATAQDPLHSPSIFPTVHSWDSHSTESHKERPSSNSVNKDVRNEEYTQPGPSRIKRESWSDSAVPHAQRRGDYDNESGRLVPISMTPTGSPRVYDRDSPRSAPLPSRLSARVPSCHCAIDRQIEEHRAAAIARGGIHLESPYAHKQQIPTPLPPAHGHIMIPFQPTPGAYPGRSFGVCMADILDFRACLVEPDTPVLDGEAREIYLTLEAKGYSTFVQKISGNCPHRRISRFNLAYIVASEYDTFLREFPFNSTGLKAAAIVVRSVTELRLVNMYSRDGGKVWRVHVAYC